MAVSRRGCFAVWVGVLVARQCGDTRGCMLASFHDAVAVVKLAPAADGAHTTGANGRPTVPADGGSAIFVPSKTKPLLFLVGSEILENPHDFLFRAETGLRLY
ncbi:MAG: hypothetical protein RLZZ232_1090 [Planctomycetota bacterium]